MDEKQNMYSNLTELDITEVKSGVLLIWQFITAGQKKHMLYMVLNAWMDLIKTDQEKKSLANFGFSSGFKKKLAGGALVSAQL